VLEVFHAQNHANRSVLPVRAIDAERRSSKIGICQTYRRYNETSSALESRRWGWRDVFVGEQPVKMSETTKEEMPIVINAVVHPQNCPCRCGQKLASGGGTNPATSHRPTEAKREIAPYRGEDTKVLKFPFREVSRLSRIEADSPRTPRIALHFPMRSPGLRYCLYRTLRPRPSTARTGDKEARHVARPICARSFFDGEVSRA
jgi:hypothetical protein